MSPATERQEGLTPAEESPEPATKVLDSGGTGPSSDQPLTLLEASRLAKERRKTAQAPIAVITNQNLHEYAQRGKLTIASSANPPVDSEPEEASTPPEGQPRDERYWRSRALELREGWRSSVDAIVELEARAEALRHEFYSERDLYRRDTRVKPAWDRVLDRLERAKKEAEQGRDDLVAFMEEGRREGALPGWLREGIDLEPEADRVSDDDLPTTQSTDPVVIDGEFR